MKNNNIYLNSATLLTPKYTKKFINNLVKNNIVAFNNQISVDEKLGNQIVFNADQKEDYDEILPELFKHNSVLYEFENFEFNNLYNFSIPFFYSMKSNNISTKSLKKFEKSFDFYNNMDYSSIDKTPAYIETNEYYLIKIVYSNEIFTKTDKNNIETLEYRFVFLIYLNKSNNLLNIRFSDSLPNSENKTTYYKEKIPKILLWLENNLDIDIFYCIENDIREKLLGIDSVHLLDEQMDFRNGGSAKLCTSKESNYIMPFIGELKELLINNLDTFSTEGKTLLEDFIKDKEDNAIYDYLKFILKDSHDLDLTLKVTFVDQSHDYNLIFKHYKHGTHTNLNGLERMNYELEYLRKIDGIIKGSKF